VKILTWNELQALTPEQRREHFDRAVVLDPASDPDPVIRALYDDAAAWAAENLPRAAARPDAGRDSRPDGA
jgi:hypothetical protein